MTDPIAPTGGELQLADGRVLPLELVYEGVDGDGIHQWRATAVVGLDVLGGATIRFDVLPAHTGIRFDVVAP
ncbi:MAG TPA: hypothetical protein VH395_08900 [Jatrophihabitantaceae bacterium]|jgi:hypothetical protein